MSIGTKRKTKKFKLRVMTLNIGTMLGKARKLVDMMQRREMDILCSRDQVKR